MAAIRKIVPPPAPPTMYELTLTENELIELLQALLQTGGQSPLFYAIDTALCEHG